MATFKFLRYNVERFDIWNAFLRHHIQELQPF